MTVVTSQRIIDLRRHQIHQLFTHQRHRRRNFHLGLLYGLRLTICTEAHGASHFQGNVAQLESITSLVATGLTGLLPKELRQQMLQDAVVSEDDEVVRAFRSIISAEDRIKKSVIPTFLPM